MRVRMPVTSLLALFLVIPSPSALAGKCGVVPKPAFTDLCAGLSSSMQPVKLQYLPKPKVRGSYIDPQFGSKVVRISDAGKNGVIKPMYSTVQAWNADESLILLYGNVSGKQGHHLYDGNTYAWLGTVDIQPGDLEQVFWHGLDPDQLIYVDADDQRVMRYSIKSGVSTVSYDFSEQCQGNELTTGIDTQMPSWDSRFIGLRCGGSNDERALVMVLDLDNNQLVSNGLTGVGKGSEDQYNAWMAPAVAPSGKRLFFQGDVSSLRFERQRELALYSPAEHSSLGRLPSGNDAYFAIGFNPATDAGRCDQSIGTVVAHDLNTGACDVVIGPARGHAYPASSTHLSALSYRNPGWVAVSSVGDTENAKIGKEQQVFHQEIYLAYADPKRPKICRVAHHRSMGKDNTQLKVPYFAEPHVGISPSGTRLIFGSDWHGGDSVDTYVVELPSYEPCD